MYICIEREDKERSFLALNSCKIKMNKNKSMVTIEGPYKSSSYFSIVETIFLVKSEEIAIRFLRRKNILMDCIHLTIIGDVSKLKNIVSGDKDDSMAN